MNPFALVPRRSAWPTVTIDSIAQLLSLNPFTPTLHPTLRQDREEIGSDFASLVGAFQRNSVVYAVEMKRLELFGAVKFRFQELRNGTGGNFFGTPQLDIIEHPEPGDTTSDLVKKIVLSVDFGGTAFVVRRARPDRLRVVRPDWTTVVLGSPSGNTEPNGIDVEMAGIIYKEGGPMGSADPQVFFPGEFAPIRFAPDPLTKYLGTPWLYPVIREIQADTAATTHKLKFFENGATPSTVVTLDPSLTIEKAREWIALFDQDHRGVLNAYKTIFLGGGAKAEVVGRDLEQLDFKNTQGAGETRIAAAAGIHPTIVGLSEGLQGSSLNTGNFAAARRVIADSVLHSGWMEIAGSLETIVPPPSGSRLWYDPKESPFLRDDVKDAAEVLAHQAQAIRTLSDGGYEPDSVVDAVTSGDLKRLRHTGLLPVQVQEPGAGQDEASGNRAVVAAAEERLRLAGLKPTQERIAEALDVSVRTVQRWMAS